jgi:hypothetical protein
MMEGITLCMVGFGFYMCSTHTKQISLITKQFAMKLITYN